MWLQEPELSLRRTAACTLADIAKHTPELAQGIVDAGTVPFVAPLVSHGDAKLRREVTSSALVFLVRASIHDFHLELTMCV